MKRCRKLPRQQFNLKQASFSAVRQTPFWWMKKARLPFDWGSVVICHWLRLYGLKYPICLYMWIYPDFRNRDKRLLRFWGTWFCHLENSKRKWDTVACSLKQISGAWWHGAWSSCPAQTRTQWMRKGAANSACSILSENGFISLFHISLGSPKNHS